ncbi:2,3-diaminopropionate biosynthesis protein SbnA [Chitinophaga sp. S165]|uniref:2,3-diaminopropionate biosynthesis protein SbnA n=1 Tax=Chitinophaga sp. S165 TaxID=2135462 RepID=UPI000D991385|nr:2,3-diaminopropionate biosynthesis protein SbnA [Chitinophaga sp. S165]PWV46101.1 cysteine synthase A [Chitinophaga sp. S165]
MSMFDKLEKIKYLIGNTPVHTVEVMNITLGIKLEYFNLFGSIKDRPAFNIIYEAVKSGRIGQDTTIIESSSGNFAIALANICHYLGLKFIPVVDPNINKDYLQLLKVLCSEVIMVTDRDATGGYLLTRIRMVESLCSKHPDSFWTNQYNNPHNYLCYYDSLGRELLNQLEGLTHVFIAVSTGGTLAGLSKRIKEEKPSVEIVAVDIEGSVIFNQPPKSRYISGLGSSMVPPLLSHAQYDKVLHVTHEEIIDGCRALYNDTHIFAGGSSGAVYQGIRQYFSTHASSHECVVAMCCPDRGNAYMDTLYNNEWCNKFKKTEQLCCI